MKIFKLVNTQTKIIKFRKNNIKTKKYYNKTTKLSRIK